jgi:hypothetical protein
MSCPACGGPIREGAVLCRHCHTKFAEPARAGMSLVGAVPGRAPRRPHGSAPILPAEAGARGSSATVWLVFGGFGLLIFVGTAAFFLIARSMKDKVEARQVDECRASMLRLAMRIRDADTELDEYNGSALLYRLDGRCQCALGLYRGPAAAWANLKPDSVVACDAVPGHRGGIHVLLRSGAVEWASPGSPLHRRALSETLEGDFEWGSRDE